MRGATRGKHHAAGRDGISIHAPHAGRDGRPLVDERRRQSISIHAPHAGRDDSRPSKEPRQGRHFNPRAPCGARRLQETIFDLKMEFQSTRPMRGATYGEELAFWDEIISIHAPLAGRDPQQWQMPLTAFLFQSTRPARGATAGNFYQWRGGTISIHAPREGRDFLMRSKKPTTTKFQSTRPARGATRSVLSYDEQKHDFNPRAPRGARRGGRRERRGSGGISIHAPREGRDAIGGVATGNAL